MSVSGVATSYGQNFVNRIVKSLTKKAENIVAKYGTDALHLDANISQRGLDALKHAGIEVKAEALPITNNSSDNLFDVVMSKLFLLLKNGGGEEAFIKRYASKAARDARLEKLKNAITTGKQVGDIDDTKGLITTTSKHPNTVKSKSFYVPFGETDIIQVMKVEPGKKLNELGSKFASLIDSMTGSFNGLDKKLEALYSLFFQKGLSDVASQVGKTKT